MFTWCELSSGIQAHSLLNKVLQESVGISVDMPKIFLFSVNVCAFIQFDMGFYRIWSTLTFMLILTSAKGICLIPQKPATKI